MTAAAVLFALVLSTPCGTALPLEGGDTSPCDGILVPAAEALRAIQCSRVGLPGCQAELMTSKATCSVKLGAASQTEDALLDRVSRAEAALGAMVRCPECERAWWDSPVIWGGAGVTVGVAVTLAILKATALAQ